MLYYKDLIYRQPKTIWSSNHILNAHNLNHSNICDQFQVYNRVQQTQNIISEKLFEILYNCTPISRIIFHLINWIRRPRTLQLKHRHFLISFKNEVACVAILLPHSKSSPSLPQSAASLQNSTTNSRNIHPEITLTSPFVYKKCYLFQWERVVLKIFRIKIMRPYEGYPIQTLTKLGSTNVYYGRQSTRLCPPPPRQPWLHLYDEG